MDVNTSQSRLKRKVTLILAISNIIDSDSDDDFIETTLQNKVFKSESKRCRIARKDYIENVALLYSVDDFRNHYRLRRDTFEHLVQMLGPMLIAKNLNGAGPYTYSPTKQLLVVLSMLVNQEEYRIIAARFDISKSTARSYVVKVCNVLSNLARKYICWPTGNKAQETIEDFKKILGFPGVLGAIDKCHIPINNPSKFQTVYGNRHRHHAIILQAVCNANYMFTNVFTGYPSSAHDAHVFNNSPLGRKIASTPLNVFPDNTSHILGDSAYKCSNYVITPYRDDGNLSRKERQFNYKHSSTKACIEECFSLLKGRFRVLKYINVYNIKMIPKIITACCVLHNICIARDDKPDDCQVDDESIQFNICDDLDIDLSGISKRNIIADNLFVTRVSNK